jgi:hypothetical protein
VIARTNGSQLQRFSSLSFESTNVVVLRGYSCSRTTPVGPLPISAPSRATPSRAGNRSVLAGSFGVPQRSAGGGSGWVYQLMTTEHALLGMLARYGEQSGYDLLRLASEGVGHIFSPAKSHVYDVLPRLERGGHVRRRLVPQTRLRLV